LTNFLQALKGTGLVATLTISESQRLALRKLRDLPDAKVKQITAALSEKPLAVTKIQEVASRLKPVLPDVSASDLEAIADTLLFLYYVRAQADLSVEKFVSDISRAFRDTAGEKFSEEEFSSFKDRIAELLNVESMRVSAVAHLEEYLNRHNPGLSGDKRSRQLVEFWQMQTSPSILERRDFAELIRALVERWSEVREAQPENECGDDEADIIDEEELELRCLPTPPASVLQTNSAQLRLSKASSRSARRMRGLPLLIADSDEEPQ
jgi:hypothetical protein